MREYRLTALQEGPDLVLPGCRQEVLLPLPALRTDPATNDLGLATSSMPGNNAGETATRNSIATISPRSSYLGRRWTGAYEQQEGLDSSFTNYCRTGYLVAIMALSQKDMRNENTVKGLEATVDNMLAAYDNMRKLTTILEQSSTRMCSILYSDGP